MILQFSFAWSLFLACTEDVRPPAVYWIICRRVLSIFQLLLFQAFAFRQVSVGVLLLGGPGIVVWALRCVVFFALEKEESPWDVLDGTTLWWNPMGCVLA